MKGKFSRLCPAIARAIEDVKVRDMQKQAEEALLKSERLFREITENSSDILVITDQNGNIKYCSRSIERFTGYKPAEITGQSVFTFIHPEERQRAVDDFSKAVLTNDNVLIHNGFRIIHKDGSEVYLDGIGRNLLSNQDIAGFVMNVRDITTNKRMEEKIRREEERFRALAELSSDIILLVNQEGIILYENPAVEKILEFKVEERIGGNVFENLHPDDLPLVTDAFRKLMSDQNYSAQQSEIRVRHRNGNWRIFEVVASGLKKGNAVEALIVNLRDITERKKAENAL
jgi:PAS domain S-box-containing protein